MSLTPVDILHTEFKTGLRGYNKTQVDQFVQAAKDTIEEALRDKRELQQQITVLQEEVDRVRKIESALTDTLVVAQRSADELKAAAHKQAEMIIQEAEHARVRLTIDAQQETEKLRADAELIRATRDMFEAEFKGMLNIYLDWLDKRRSDNVRSEVA